MKSSAVKAGRAFSLVATYFTAALIGGWLLKRNIVLATTLAKLPALLLILMNMIFVFSGIPLSAVVDLLLLRQVGIGYVFFWPFVVAMASCAQIFFFRSPYCRTWSLPLSQRLQRRSKVVMAGKSGQAFFVLLIRAVPLMPFMLGSFIIAMLPSVSNAKILIFSILGCYLYYAYFAAGFFFGASAFGS